MAHQAEIVLGVSAGAMTGITAAMSGFNELVSTVDQATMRLGKGFGDVNMFLVGATVSVAAFQAAATNAYGEFERSMNAVKAVSGQTQQEIDALGNTAAEMSSKFNMGIEEITDGLVTLGRAGLKEATTQTEVLQNGLEMAKVSGDSLATTLENIIQMTSLLGGDMDAAGFGQQSETVSNLLVATSLSGPLNVNDVVQTLQYAGGTAAAGGANLENQDELETLFGGIAAFSKKGVTGSMAGTALRAFYTKPASQDKQVTEGLSMIGLRPDDLWEDGGNKMKDLATQIGIIKNAMKDLSEMDQINVWGKIVGPKMGQQMMKLDAADIRKSTADVQKQATLDETANQTLSGFSSALGKLEKQANTFFREIGQNSAKALTPVIEMVTKLLEILSNPLVTMGIGTGLSILVGTLILKLTSFLREFKNSVMEVWAMLKGTDPMARRNGKLDPRTITGYSEKETELNNILSKRSQAELKKLQSTTDATKAEQYRQKIAEREMAASERNYQKMFKYRTNLEDETLMKDMRLANNKYGDFGFIYSKGDKSLYDYDNPQTFKRMMLYNWMNEKEGWNLGKHNLSADRITERVVKNMDKAGTLALDTEKGRAQYLKNFRAEYDQILKNKATEKGVVNQARYKQLLKDAEKNLYGNEEALLAKANQYRQYKANNYTTPYEQKLSEEYARHKAMESLSKGATPDEAAKVYKKTLRDGDALSASIMKRMLGIEDYSSKTKDNFKHINTDSVTTMRNFSNTLQSKSERDFWNNRANQVETSANKRTIGGTIRTAWSDFRAGFSGKMDERPMFRDMGMWGMIKGQYQQWRDSLGKDVSFMKKLGGGIGSVVSSLGAFELGTMAATAAIAAFQMAQQEYQKRLSERQSEFSEASSKLSEAQSNQEQFYREQNPDVKGTDVQQNLADQLYKGYHNAARKYAYAELDKGYQPKNKTEEQEEAKKEEGENKTEDDRLNEQLQKNTEALIEATAAVRDAIAALADEMEDGWFGHDGGFTNLYEDLKSALGGRVFDIANDTNSLLYGFNRDDKNKAIKEEDLIADQKKRQDEYYDKLISNANLAPHNDMSELVKKGAGFQFTESTKDAKLNDAGSIMLDVSKVDFSTMMGPSGARAMAKIGRTNASYFNNLQGSLNNNFTNNERYRAAQGMSQQPNMFRKYASLQRQLTKDPNNKMIKEQIRRTGQMINNTLGTNFDETKLNQLAEIQQLSDLMTLGEQQVLPSIEAEIEGIMLDGNINAAGHSGTQGAESATTAQVAAIAAILGAVIMGKNQEKFVQEMIKSGQAKDENDALQQLGQMEKKSWNDWDTKQRDAFYKAYGKTIGLYSGLGKDEDGFTRNDMATYMNNEWKGQKYGDQPSKNVFSTIENGIDGYIANALQTEIDNGALENMMGGGSDSGSGGGGGGGGSGSGNKKDSDSGNKKSRVDLVLCNKKEIPKLNVNLFKKEPTFTVLNKNFKMGDMKINTQDSPKSIMNSVKNAIISTQERMDPKIIRSEEGQYDPVAATDGTQTPSGTNTTN